MAMGKSLGVELLGDTASASVIYKESARQFCKLAVPFSSAPAVWRGSAGHLKWVLTEV